MEVGAVGLQPYIYNTNQVNATSMNPVPPVPSDLGAERTDFSGMVGAGVNENPLRPGETADFQAIVESQMAMSEQNAARVMRTEGESSNLTTENTTAGQESGTQTGTETTQPGNTPTNGATETSAFVNVIPDGLERPITNAAVELAQANAEAGRTVMSAEYAYETGTPTTTETETVTAPIVTAPNTTETETAATTAPTTTEGATAATTADGTVTATATANTTATAATATEGATATATTDTTTGTATVTATTDGTVTATATAGATTGTTATAATEQTTEDTTTQPTLFQMGRAAEAYAMTMGQMAA